MKKVLITGATGLIGRCIIAACHDKDIVVHFLTTDASKLQEIPNSQGFLWDPETAYIDVNCFEGVSVIINLAGAPIAQRWTKKARNEINNSRIKSLRLLYKTITTQSIQIDHLISSSAIGYYPPSYTHYYEESHTNEDQSFIVDVVRKWEKEANTFKALDIPVSIIRLGVVLAKDGGALPQLIKPINRFYGAYLGTGKQWQSWIHIEDACNIFIFAMKHQLDGIYNAVAPNPVTHKVLIQQIAKQLKKPIILPNIPENLLRLILGEIHILITKGARVSSRKIENLGFSFKFHQIEIALQDLF